jgi:predicted GTPase
MPQDRRRVVILGAAGRDFHCFNRVYREDPAHEVVAFTATQIPGIDARRYPAQLAGKLYPKGIPVRAEADLESLCREEAIDLVVFAYSDVTHAHVMHLASRALACGADFGLLGPRSTMLVAHVPVIAISAVRTGCGKSQTARWITQQRRSRGLRTAAIRHPMPYGNLEAQRVQRFASRSDIDAARCTAEEREEYELYVDAGAVICAGVDYAEILQQAEQEAEVIVWDGGNNDFPFIRPDLHIVVVDALRPDQVDTHHPGEAALRMANLVLINKTDAAPPSAIQRLTESVRRVNPKAPILRAASPVRLDEPAAVAGRRVIVVEDGPTTTHGGMAYGAGHVAAVDAGAAEIVDPRESAVPEVAAVFQQYPHIGKILPAMGYGPAQIAALRATIEGSRAELVVTGSPIDLDALLDVRLPVVRARYAFQDVDDPGLAGVLETFCAEHMGTREA